MFGEPHPTRRKVKNAHRIVVKVHSHHLSDDRNSDLSPCQGFPMLFYYLILRSTWAVLIILLACVFTPSPSRQAGCTSTQQKNLTLRRQLYRMLPMICQATSHCPEGGHSSCHPHQRPEVGSGKARSARGAAGGSAEERAPDHFGHQRLCERGSPEAEAAARAQQHSSGDAPAGLHACLE